MVHILNSLKRLLKKDSKPSRQGPPMAPYQNRLRAAELAAREVTGISPTLGNDKRGRIRQRARDEAEAEFENALKVDAGSLRPGHPRFATLPDAVARCASYGFALAGDEIREAVEVVRSYYRKSDELRRTHGEPRFTFSDLAARSVGFDAIPEEIAAPLREAIRAEALNQ